LDWIGKGGTLEYRQEVGSSPGTFRTLHTPLVRLGGDIAGAIAINPGLAGSETPRIKIALEQKPGLRIAGHLPAPVEKSNTEDTMEISGKNTLIVLQVKAPAVKPDDATANPETEPAQEQRFPVRIWPKRRIEGRTQPFSSAEGNGCNFTLLWPDRSREIPLAYVSTRKGLPILIGTLVSYTLPDRDTFGQVVLSISGDLDRNGLPCRHGQLPLHPIDVRQEGIDARVVFK